MTLSFRPVTQETRADFEALFTARGAPGYCWCMAWRATSEELKHTKSLDRRRQMLGRIGSGVPVGLLAYEDGTPVGWVSVAPRETFRNLGGPPADGAVWSLTCMFVPRARRRQGLSARLIAAAIRHARENKAAILEAYPVDPDSPSYRFMGFVPAFEAAGFTRVGTAGTRRHVMRLTL